MLDELSEHPREFCSVGARQTIDDFPVAGRGVGRHGFVHRVPPRCERQRVTAPIGGLRPPHDQPALLEFAYGAADGHRLERPLCGNVDGRRAGMIG